MGAAKRAHGAVAGPPGDPTDGVVDAVSRLYGAGLVHVLAGEFVTATRAARAMEELTM